jgi:hypothetical protein
MCHRSNFICAATFGIVPFFTACSEDPSRDDGAASGATNNGGSGGMSFTSSGGAPKGSGGEAASGGSNAASGGAPATDPPLLSLVPEVEDKCTAATDDCIWVIGNEGGVAVETECGAESFLLGSLATTAFGCSNDTVTWNVAFKFEVDVPFAVDILQDDENHGIVFAAGAGDGLEKESRSFAGAHCAGIWDGVANLVSGTCFAAWGDGDNYDSVVATSYRIFL